MSSLRMTIQTQVYKTLTGAFVSDNKGLNSGDYLFDPTLLIKQNESKGIKTTSLHSFKYTPIGAVSR